MKKLLLILLMLATHTQAFADPVLVKSYQDVRNAYTPIDLSFPTTCIDWNLTDIPSAPSFNTIQVQPVLLTDGSLDPHHIEIRAFNESTPRTLVKGLIVDLADESNFYFDPNQSGDPIFRLEATGVDEGTTHVDHIHCGNSY